MVLSLQSIPRWYGRNLRVKMADGRAAVEGRGGGGKREERNKSLIGFEVSFRVRF